MAVKPLLPPTKEEQTLFISANKLSFYFLGGPSLALLLAGIWLFVTHNQNVLWVFGPLLGFISFYLILSFAVGVFSKPFDYVKHQYIQTRLNSTPPVDIFYAISGEDMEVMVRAMTHIVALARAYPGKCTIYVCDDSKDGRGLRLLDRFEHDANVVWSRRPNLGHMKKAGNLKYAFDKSKGEFIAIFDADFCPSLEFFSHTLPYLLQDPKIGLVQTPQYFCTDTHETWVGKGAAYVQELFYRMVQPSRNEFGGAICVGTNALYRRAALAPLGGTAQVPYSEDVRTGFNLLQAGWQVLYIPIILAKGLCPETLPAYLLQQHRWALGSISLFFSKSFWQARITFWQRICFLSGMFYYITTGIGLPFMFIPALYMLLFEPQNMVWFSIFFSLPSLIFGTLYQAQWGKLKWGMYAVRARQAAYYAHLFALVEYLTGNLTPWQPTGVATKTQLYTRFQNLCFWLMTLGTFSVFGLVLWRIPVYGWEPFAPTLFFTSFNYYVHMTLLRDQI